MHQLLRSDVRGKTFLTYICTMTLLNSAVTLTTIQLTTSAAHIYFVIIFTIN